MIGVFDSGLGGLTALRHLRAVAPETAYVYFGDTGRVPYGTRSQDTILRYALEDLQLILRFSPDAILVACGTVSANALHVLQEVSPVPVLGVIQPAVQAAVRATRNGRIGVLGTPATIRTHAYRRALLQLAPCLVVEEVACPLFVPMVESGMTDGGDPIVSAICARYLEPLKALDVDTLILGCTHYPLLADAIARVLPRVALIDPGAEATDLLLPYLHQEKHPLQQYFVSDDAKRFSASAALFLGVDISGTVHQIEMKG